MLDAIEWISSIVMMAGGLIAGAALIQAKFAWCAEIGLVSCP